MFELSGYSRSFGPLEWRRGLVVGGREQVNGLPQLLDRGKAGSPERLAAQDTEPALDLIEPRCVGRGVMKVDLGMARPSGIGGYGPTSSFTVFMCGRPSTLKASPRSTTAWKLGAELWMVALPYESGAGPVFEFDSGDRGDAVASAGRMSSTARSIGKHLATTRGESAAPHIPASLLLDADNPSMRKDCKWSPARLPRANATLLTRGLCHPSKICQSTSRLAVQRPVQWRALSSC